MDERTTEEKVADYRKKYPQRIVALNGFVAPLLGITARTTLKPETVAEMCHPLVDKLIAACWGLDA